MRCPAKICNTCKYWSDLVSEARNGKEIKALCLAEDGPFYNQMTGKFHTCDKQEEGDPIDARNDWTPQSWEIGRIA